MLQCVMLSEDDINYAVEQTVVLHPPQRRIESFGNTVFHFYLLTELMDSAHEVRVRDGTILAERPQIITPKHYSSLMLEGFGEKASDFSDWLKKHSGDFTILKYGFHIKRTEVTETIVHESLHVIAERIYQEISHREEELSAIISGVDDAWEICLLKFTMDLIRKSSENNLGDFRSEGLL